MNQFHVTLGVLVLICSAAFAQQQNPKAAAEEKAAEPAPVITAIGKNTSLLKVNVTSQPWNHRIPWQKSPPGGRRGLGVLLEKNQILVTGQLVTDATYIELEQADSGRKLPAKVKAVDYEANLALLEPAAAARDFFAGLTPLKLETEARIGDKLEVWQLGRVGDLISTPLEINKVLTSRYFIESSLFLVYETVGIIRSEANSFTLPVIKNGRLAGMLLRYNSRDQTATVLPGPIIQHFLKDIADGAYEGFPSFGVEIHQTLDEQFREYLGLKPGQQGICIGEISKGGSAETIGLKEGDIVLEINGKPVDSRGDYKDDKFGTLSVSHLVRGQSYIGDEMKVKVLREGKELVLSGKLTRKSAKDYVVWPYLFDRGVNYLVHGGLVFQELSVPWLQSFGEDWESSAPLRLVHAAKHADDYEKKGRRKIVFLAATLPTRSTQGYERLGGLIITKVNGKDINDLTDLDKALKEAQDGIHTIEFEDFPKLIHLDALTAESDNLRLLQGQYRVTSLKRIE